MNNWNFHPKSSRYSSNRKYYCHLLRSCKYFMPLNFMLPELIPCHILVQHRHVITQNLNVKIWQNLKSFPCTLLSRCHPSWQAVMSSFSPVYCSSPVETYLCHPLYSGSLVYVTWNVKLNCQNVIKSMGFARVSPILWRRIQQRVYQVNYELFPSHEYFRVECWWTLAKILRPCCEGMFLNIPIGFCKQKSVDNEHTIMVGSSQIVHA